MNIVGFKCTIEELDQIKFLSYGQCFQKYVKVNLKLNKMIIKFLKFFLKDFSNTPLKFKGVSIF